MPVILPAVPSLPTVFRVKVIGGALVSAVHSPALMGVLRSRQGVLIKAEIAVNRAAIHRIGSVPADLIDKDLPGAGRIGECPAEDR